MLAALIFVLKNFFDKLMALLFLRNNQKRGANEKKTLQALFKKKLIMLEVFFFPVSRTRCLRRNSTARGDTK